MRGGAREVGEAKEGLGLYEIGPNGVVRVWALAGLRPFGPLGGGLSF